MVRRCMLGAAFAAALCARVHAEHFVFFDHCFETAFKWQFWFQSPANGMNPDAPKNWESPVNYKEGTYCIMLDVSEKQGTGQQAIIFAYMNKQGCVLQRLWNGISFTATGFHKSQGNVNSGKVQHTGECDPWSWTSAWDKPWTESHTSQPPFTARMLVTVFSKGTPFDSVVARTLVTPTIEPDSGTFQEEAIEVALSTYSTMSVIRYTLDGSEPTESSPACTPEEYEPEHMDDAGGNGTNGQVLIPTPSEGTIEINATCVLKAKAFSPNMHPSAVAEAAFTLPNASLGVARDSRGAGDARAVVWQGIRNGAASMTVTADRPYVVTVADAQGRVVVRRSEACPHDFSFGVRQLGTGMFLVRVDCGTKNWARTFVLM